MGIILPVVFRYAGYRFFFFSNEGDPREPVHIHVRKGEKIAKFWVEPDVALADAYGLNSAELSRMRRVIEEHRALIVERWNEHFSGPGGGETAVV